MTDGPGYPGFHNGLGKTSKGPYFHSAMCRSCKYFINSAYINCTPFPKGPDHCQTCPSYEQVKEGEAQGRQWIPPTHTVQVTNRIEIAGEYTTTQFTQQPVLESDHGYADWPDEPDPWGHGDPNPTDAIASMKTTLAPGIGRYSSGCQVVVSTAERDALLHYANKIYAPICMSPTFTIDPSSHTV